MVPSEGRVDEGSTQVWREGITAFVYFFFEVDKGNYRGNTENVGDSETTPSTAKEGEIEGGRKTLIAHVRSSGMASTLFGGYIIVSHSLTHSLTCLLDTFPLSLFLFDHSSRLTTKQTGSKMYSIRKNGENQATVTRRKRPIPSFPSTNTRALSTLFYV